MNSDDSVRIIDALMEHFDFGEYGEVGYEGDSPYQILISTILSQQTTERNSKRASEQLFS